MSEPDGFTESGQPFYRHKELKREFEPAFGDSKNIEAISAHIEQHLGEPATVFHELISSLVHIDVHIVPPTESRPFYSLVTSGMSDEPMTVPEGFEEYRYAESKINEEKTIRFYGLFLLHQEEMELKMKKGAEALWELFIKNGVTEVLDIQRKNVAKKRFGIF